MLKPTLLPVTLFTVAFVASASAQRQRCGTPEPNFNVGPVGPSDCGYSTNKPQSKNNPTFYYDIPVVFHVIQSVSGNGYVSPARVQGQINALNEDFQAISGQRNARGTNSKIRFHLAKTDPKGKSTTGITYSRNDRWFADKENFHYILNWDTHRYLNIYSLNPSGVFGYYYGVGPSRGSAGQRNDIVVLLHSVVGDSATPQWPTNLGRTGSHEVGHYLGLYHTFNGGCASTSNCYGTGDLICDTNPQANPRYNCPSSPPQSCGSTDNIENYMNYTDDPCMAQFTPEQINRMRCTLRHFRPLLPIVVPSAEVVRIGNPANPNAFRPGRTSGPVIGETWDPWVDHSSFEPSANTDYMFVSVSFAQVHVPPFGTLLLGSVLPLVFTSSPAGRPFAIPLPSDARMLGSKFYAQAVSGSAGQRIRLTNALECVIGNN